jgi:hypothetical protein
VSAAAVQIAADGFGFVCVTYVPLLTAQEADKAIAKLTGRRYSSSKPGRACRQVG